MGLEKQTSKPPLHFLVHLLVAVPVLWVVYIAVAAVVEMSPSWAMLEIPGAGPFFPGALLLGGCVGFLMNWRRSSESARWVFVLPLLWFSLAGASSYSLGGGWQAVWRDLFSDRCQEECMAEAIATIPLFIAAAYSFAALIASRLERGRRGIPNPIDAQL